MKPRALWEKDRHRLALAMQAIAERADERWRNVFGSLAWGRYRGEPKAADNKENTIFGCGYLNGYRDALLAVSRQYDIGNQTDLERAHDDAYQDRTAVLHAQRTRSPRGGK